MVQYVSILFFLVWSVNGKRQIDCWNLTQKLPKNHPAKKSINQFRDNHTTKRNPPHHGRQENNKKMSRGATIHPFSSGGEYSLVIPPQNKLSFSSCALCPPYCNVCHLRFQNVLEEISFFLVRHSSIQSNVQEICRRFRLLDGSDQTTSKNQHLRHKMNLHEAWKAQEVIFHPTQNEIFDGNHLYRRVDFVHSMGFYNPISTNV